jgi:hypothetical protein
MVVQNIKLPYRGDGTDRPFGIVVPPARMPWMKAGRLLKSWRYVSIWSPELSICAANVGVGPVRQEFWAVWDRGAAQLHEKTRLRPCAVQLSPGKVVVRDKGIVIDVTLDERDGIEVIVPDGEAYTWTRKQMVRAYGTVQLPHATRQVEAMALIDDNAGYHRRQTNWLWSGGAGHDIEGRSVAWSVIVGLNDPARNSERTIWIDGVPREVGPVTFADDLSAVRFNDGTAVQFQEEAVRQRRDNLVLVRSSYRQPFGSFNGTLPGNIQLREAYGVMERHDAVW